MDKDRAKKLDTVFDQIEKQFGEGSLMKLGTDNVKKVPAISTGALSLVNITCFPFWCKWLKIWKKTSCVPDFPEKNWTSSIINTSISW